MTIKTLLGREKKDGTFPVLIRVTENRKVRYIPTGVHVKSSQFKDGSVKGHTDAILFNRVIERKRSEITHEVLEGSVLPSLYTAILSRLDEYDRLGKLSAYAKLLTISRNIKTIIPDIRLDKLTENHAKDYVMKRADKSVNSVKKDLGILAALLKAYKVKNVFQEVKASVKTKKSFKHALTMQDIIKVKEVELSGMMDIARDMFLFSFYTFGARFGDVLFMKRNQRDGISYQMSKNGEIVHIDITPALEKIINKYEGEFIFPLIKSMPESKAKMLSVKGNWNAIVNRHLKLVAEKAGTIPIHFHMARHSFTRIAREKGVSLDTLQKALAHSNYKTTQGYADSISNRKLNDDLRVVYIQDMQG
jgi:integrase